MCGEVDASGGDPGTQEATEQECFSLQVSCPGDASTYCSLAWPGLPDKTPRESWATKIPDVAPALYPQIMTEEWS